jgi:hypothetical protein
VVFVCVSVIEKMDGVAYDYSLAQFRHPFSCLIAGSTGSGKTHFLTNLLLHCETTINNPIQRIVYCYGTPLPETFATLKARFPFLELYKGVRPDLKFKPNTSNVVILDDLMTDAASSEEVANYFIRGTHHLNLSVFLLSQNIFQKGEFSRTISINSGYIVYFRNPRDKLTIQNLGKQMYPGQSEILIEAFEKAASTPHSYLCMDFKQDIKDEHRLKSNLLPTDPLEWPLFFFYCDWVKKNEEES